jgi:hypothetical protein
MKKIALLFLIYNKINQEEIWYDWIKNVDHNKYTIYVHYKIDEPLKYFEQYKLKECIDTKYCDITIVKAHNLLIGNALNDNDNYKFINLSQACIPLKSFDFIYDKLTFDDTYYINNGMGNSPFPRCDELLQYFDKSIIAKSANWIILNRLTANIVINYEEKYLHYFKNIYCPEEHYFCTIINKHNKEIMNDNDCTKREISTTFDNWFSENNSYIFADKIYDTKYYRRGIKNYPVISVREIDYLLASPYLFGRKFNSTCNVFDRRRKCRYYPLSEYLKDKY